jgi:membrane protease YdiL (CAAX protease family)
LLTAARTQTDDSAIDWPRWPLDRGRLAAAACVLAFAVVLVSASDRAAVLTGLLLFAEVLLLALPWRLPRSRRSRRSFWAETIAGISAPVGALAIGAATGADWLGHGAAWWWYGIALIGGAGLLALNGDDPRALLGGEMAFVLGPDRHGYARAAAGIVAPAGEEALFRGAVLAAAPAAALPVGLLSAVAFVAIHFVQPGDNGRGSVRTFLIMIVSAVALLAVTMASGSIYPAVLLHAVKNVPGIVLQLQRGRMRGVQHGG